MKKRILLLLVPIVIFSILFSFINLSRVIDVLKHTNLKLFVMANLFVFPIHLTLSEKWRQILKDIGCDIPLKEAFFIFWGAIPISQFLPLRSGELVKAIYLKKRKNFSFKKGTSAVILDNIIDLTMLLFISIISLVVFKIHLSIEVYVCFIITMGVLSLLFILSKKFSNDIFHALRIIKMKKIFLLSCYSLLSFMLSGSSIYLVMKSVNIEIPVYSFLSIMPIITLISTIPITLSGLGSREAAIIFFFSEYASKEALLSAGILISLTVVFIPVVIGLVFMRKLLR